MKTHIVRLFAGLLALGFFGPFSVAEAKTHSFNTLVEKALKDNPAIEAAYAQYRSTRQSLNEAESAIFPQVSLEGTLVKQDVPPALTGGFDLSPDRIYSGHVVVEQPLFLGGKIWAGMSLREQEVEMARLQFLQQKQESLAQVLEVALNLALAERQLKLLTDSLKAQERFVNITRARLRRGNARQFELNQALANLYSYQTRIQQNATQIKVLKAQLGHLIGEDTEKVDFIWPESAPPSQSATEKPVENWLEYAVLHRPEAMIARVNIELARVQKRLNFGDHLPSLSLRGKWGYSSLDRESFGEEDTKATELAVAISIPIFSGLTSVYQRRADSEKIAAAEKSRESFLRQLKAEVTQYYQELQEAEALLKNARQWSRSASTALKEAMESYRLGLIDNFQVVQLQTGEEAALLAESEALVAHHLAWIHWNQAIGKDIEEVYLGRKTGL